MKQIHIGIFALSFLLVAGCASMVKMDENYLSKNARSSYNYSQSKCYDAAKTVIKDLGGEIQKEKKKEHKFVTTRFNIHQVVQAYGSPYGMTATTTKEDHKFYIGVSGDKESCIVQILKYRVWTNNKELTEINEKFVKPRVFDSFFNDLKAQLKDKF